MNCTVIIPARMASTRFPGKPLADIHGKPMIQHVYDAAVAADVGPVVIATDSNAIADWALAVGAVCDLNHAEAKCGCERAARIDHDRKTTLVLQCDEPDIQPGDIRRLAMGAEQYGASTLATECGEDRPGAVHVVTDYLFRSLYFSRQPLTGSRMHVGAYGFSTDGLRHVYGLPQSPLEIAENLEQLRWLSHGRHFGVYVCDHKFRSVNFPADLEQFQ